MKKIIYLTLFSIVLFAFTSQSPYNYHQEATLTGVASEIEYKTPSGDSYHTYILKLAQTININANNEWEAKQEVIEIQLSIPDHKMLRFKDKTVRVTGELFGAVNEHHRREVCLKVNEIGNE